MTTANRPAKKPQAVMLAVGYLAAGLMPLVLALAQNVSPAHSWEVLAAGLGMVGLAAMAVQFLTSGRFRTVSGGLGIDQIMAFHKIAAWWVMLGLLAHPILYVVPTWQADPAHAVERLTAYLTLPHYRTGVVALVALLLLFVSSTLREWLPLRYEVWRAAHILLALTAVFGGLHHAVTAGRFSLTGAVAGYWLLVAAIVATAIGVLYGWRWWQLHRQPYVLTEVTRRADRIWELDIQPRGETQRMRYHAGQFVWITVAGRRFPLFDHPFSIADSPERPGLSLIIKEVGDFTSQIGSLKPGTAIGLDGPHGEFTLEAHEATSVLLIAGGAGIAPIMGLLRDLHAKRDPRPVRLAYAAGDPDNFACVNEINSAAQTLDLQSLLISETPDPQWSGATGRLDRDRLAAMLEGLDRERCVAMICGPGPMVTAVSDTLLDLGLPMDRVVYERFDYSGGTSRQDRQTRRRFLWLGALLAAGVAAFAIALL